MSPITHPVQLPAAMLALAKSTQSDEQYPESDNVEPQPEYPKEDGNEEQYPENEYYESQYPESQYPDNDYEESQYPEIDLDSDYTPLLDHSRPITPDGTPARTSQLSIRNTSHRLQELTETHQPQGEGYYSAKNRALDRSPIPTLPFSSAKLCVSIKSESQTLVPTSGPEKQGIPRDEGDICLEQSIQSSSESQIGEKRNRGIDNIDSFSSPSSSPYSKRSRVIYNLESKVQGPIESVPAKFSPSSATAEPHPNIQSEPDSPLSSPLTLTLVDPTDDTLGSASSSSLTLPLSQTTHVTSTSNPDSADNITEDDYPLSHESPEPSQRELDSIQHFIEHAPGYSQSKVVEWARKPWAHKVPALDSMRRNLEEHDAFVEREQDMRSHYPQYKHLFYPY